MSVYSCHKTSLRSTTNTMFQMYEGIVENEKRRTLLAMVTAMDDAAEVRMIFIDFMITDTA